MKKHATCVLGLQFGDEGKGMVVNSLIEDPSETIVVRFSGGQQAGHTVIHEGVKHVFSSFGAGALKGAPSYFTEHTCIYPNNLWRELQVLREKGKKPTIWVHPKAALTTPSDVAFGRVKEANLKHGSCGLGIGATMARQQGPHKIYAIDFFYPDILKQKLRSLQTHYALKTASQHFPKSLNLDQYHEELGRELKLFETLANNPPFQLADYKDIRYKYFNRAIFEGSQGILLDMDHGVAFPNVTYANTTSKNAMEVCPKLGFRMDEILYVTRCYQTRHGNGWMSNETPIPLINNKGETNVTNEWQKEFRIGELDYQLLNYALEVDGLYSSNALFKAMVITCNDQRPDFIFDESQINSDLVKGIYYTSSPETNKLIQWVNEEKEKE